MVVNGERKLLMMTCADAGLLRVPIDAMVKLSTAIAPKDFFICRLPNYQVPAKFFRRSFRSPVRFIFQSHSRGCKTDRRLARLPANPDINWFCGLTAKAELHFQNWYGSVASLQRCSGQAQHVHWPDDYFLGAALWPVRRQPSCQYEFAQSARTSMKRVAI
jgi:hypothetical protein